MLSPSLINLYTEHIVRNARMEELQAGIMIGRRNIKNLSYADDTTLEAESKEELKSLLMKVKEESERAYLKLNIKIKKKKKPKTKIMALATFVVVVQSLIHVQFFVTPWTAAHQASLSITISQSLPNLMSIELVIPSNDLILCHLLLLPPSIFPSIRVFSNESVLRIRWPKYWSFSFSISPSNEYSGLISFRMDWLDLLAVQGTLKSLLQHHSSKA